MIPITAEDLNSPDTGTLPDGIDLPEGKTDKVALPGKKVFLRTVSMIETGTEGERLRLTSETTLANKE